MDDRDHLWANIVIAGAHDEEAILVVEAINKLTASKRVNRASVMLACGQILAQCITQAPLGISAEIRTSIISLIDSYAMRSAVGDGGQEPPAV